MVSYNPNTFMQALPSINASDQDLQRATGEAWAALIAANDPFFLFRRGGDVVRIEEGDDGAPVLQKVNPDRLRHILAREINWYTQRNGSQSSALPPMHVVRDMLATPDPPLPVLQDVVEVPVLGPDGTLQTEPGYHPNSRTFYRPPPGPVLPQVPPNPSTADLKRARELILQQLLGDFPFAVGADLAHAVSLLLLPFVRNLISGPTPLHLVEKPRSGTGGTLLVEIALFAAAGRTVPTMTEGRDEDEWRRRITASLLDALSVIFMDNLSRPLDSPALAGALTATVWGDRRIGASQTVRLPVRCVWVATGNNPSLSEEIRRRAIRIRLDAKCPDPSLRSGFRHPNLREWVSLRRQELIWAALTISRAWVRAGRPPGSEIKASFEDWSRVLGGILNVAEIPGFLQNERSFRASANPDEQAWLGFLTRWWTRYGDAGVGVADLYPLASQGDTPLDLAATDTRSGRIRLGKKLGGTRDRHFETQIGDKTLTVRLEAAGVVHNTQLWRLRPV